VEEVIKIQNIQTHTETTKQKQQRNKITKLRQILFQNTYEENTKNFDKVYTLTSSRQQTVGKKILHVL
jgi:hypothetical protein